MTLLWFGVVSSTKSQNRHYCGEAVFAANLPPYATSPQSQIYLSIQSRKVEVAWCQRRGPMYHTWEVLRGTLWSLFLQERGLLVSKRNSLCDLCDFLNSWAKVFLIEFRDSRPRLKGRWPNWRNSIQLSIHCKCSSCQNWRPTRRETWMSDVLVPKSQNKIWPLSHTGNVCSITTKCLCTSTWSRRYETSRFTRTFVRVLLCLKAGLGTVCE